MSDYDIMSRAQRTALTGGRLWLAENLPQFYSPEMTDDEVTKAIIRAWTEHIEPAVRGLAVYLDEHVPQWRDLLPDSTEQA